MKLPSRAALKLLIFAVILLLFGHGYARADVTNNLIACYPFAGNAADASGNGRDGAATNTTLAADRFGHPGEALGFDGVDSLVSVPDAVPLRLAATDFTVAAWIFESQRNTNYNDCIASKRNGGSGDGWFFAVRGLRDPAETGHLFFNVSAGADPRMYSAQAISTNQWHHVAFVYHLTSNSMDMYVDGVIDSSTNGLPSPNPNTAIAMQIGKDTQGAYSDAYFFHGNIDQVRFYNRALVAADISELYTQGLYLFDPGQPAVGVFTANIGGVAAGQTVVFQSSPDLLSWTSFETNVAGNSPLIVTNFINSAVPRQFFRAYTP